MDVRKIQPSGAVAVHKTAQVEDTLRPPLVPSEKNNAVPTSHKTRTREIASRYKSGISPTPISTPSTTRRCPSPNSSRTSPSAGTLLPKRSQSAERRRPSTPPRPSTPSSPSSRPSTPSTPSSRSTTPVHNTVKEMHITSRRLISNRAPDGLWPSMRSLSSSFQSESISIPVSKKEKVISSSSSDQNKSSANRVPERKRTPLRGRNTSDQCENSRPLENSHARVIDQHRWPAMMGGKLSATAMSRSVDLTDKVNRSVPMSRGVSPRRMPASDGAGKSLQKSLSEVARQLAIDGTVTAEKKMGSSVNLSSPTLERSTSATRPSRTLSSPIRGLQRSSSPSKVMSITSSTSRSMQSPSRTRPSTPGHSSISGNSPTIGRSSVLNYIADARKGKRNASHIEDVHQLRLLYNRNLQWRCVNAHADETLTIQKRTAESKLYSVWDATSMVRDSVIMKRIGVQQLRQEMKLNMILKEQIAYLEHWAASEREHCSSLSGAIEALKASTLRLPVTGGARADVLAVKNAVSSAVDVMQVMGSSVCYLLSKVEGTKSLVSELSVVATKEKSMLDECRELLAAAAALQVQESSLRTHLIQLRQEALTTQ
ncbi:AUGMIN subunit 8-like [Typha angustifolia]|uniref:AUGMIN subunit 8-like n=1 Tax=Typha angustifolia TaxID=59011 RepID=UPI003C2EDBC8